MDPSLLLVFAGALVVNAGSPGPSIAALVSRVLTRGFRDVLPFLAAMWLGEVLWLTLAVAGLAAIAETFHLLFVAIKWAGIAYLLYLAWKMWTAPDTVDAAAMATDRSPVRMFLAGMAVTLGNPKIMVFYLALLPSIINVEAITLLGWAELALTLLTVIIAIDLTWSLLAIKARTFLRTPRAVRVTNRASATLMTGAAVAIATR
ncbi:MAG: LysE family translocator [Thermomicrobiales bacterium]|jgi:threonine/homoserine/homoserine lactone efflux protein